ncbi:hypothetical protein [Candidatus Mycoplasma haematohominis]|uniref:Uncharacterized protein n=1 Tax=Candidatus Mycoplasma haematohominis TaxID=1494318 RepID=A0A478FP29_9MOLU|nr:hypothetical protein [Candidatus Mycoplasma haemohominis]GCE63058.1 hypothetical protein MHSWG343_00360 [Candidatus Mycoplasma haemohominis]
MASPAAVGGGLLGAGAIGVGSAYLAGAFEGSDSLEVEAEPANVLLSSEANFSSGYATSGWIGKGYGHYLVSPIGSQTKGNVTIDNKKWWEWSYENWKRDLANSPGTLSEEFNGTNKVSKAFLDSTSVSDSSTSLNKVCKFVYEQDKSKITPSANPAGNEVKLKNNLFKYCSILGEVKTISDVSKETYGNDTNYGGNPENAKKFVAITGNDKFWNKRSEEFYSNKGSKRGDDDTSKFFKKFYVDNKNEKKNIRGRCEEAYRKQSSSTESTDASPSLAEITKFCAI